MGVVVQNGDKVYIHSERAAVDFFIGSPFQMDKKRAELSLKASIVNRYKNVLSLDGKIVEDMKDIELLSQALDGIADGWNAAVEGHDTKTEVFQNMQEVINSKAQLANSAVQRIRYANKEETYAQLDKIFADLGAVYEAVYGMNLPTLLWCLQNSPRLKDSLKNSALGRYIAQAQSYAEGAIINVTPKEMQIAEEFGRLVLQRASQDSKGSVGISYTKAKTIKGRLTNFYGKVLGEKVVGAVVQGLLQDVVTNQIDPKMMHTGSDNIKALPGEQFLSEGRKMPSIRADNYSDYVEIQTEVDDTTHTISGYIGLTDKWERVNDKGQIPLTVTGTRGEVVPNTISILDKSPVVRYIDELSTSYRDAIAYLNAYPQENTEIIDIIEQDATLAGLTGSGGMFIRNGKALFDVTSFMVVNGKFYSTLGIFLNILKQKDWKSSLVIVYTNKVTAQDNTWEPPREENLLAGWKRSDRIKEAIQKMYITIRMSPTVLASYAR